MVDCANLIKGTFLAELENIRESDFIFSGEPIKSGEEEVGTMDLLELGIYTLMCRKGNASNVLIERYGLDKPMYINEVPRDIFEQVRRLREEASICKSLLFKLILNRLGLEESVEVRRKRKIVVIPKGSDSIFRLPGVIISFCVGPKGSEQTPWDTLGKLDKKDIQ